MSDNHDEDKVGYKKPPKKSQFKKGKSGNPKGRPPKKCFQVAFYDALNEELTLNLNGEKVTMTIKEAILKKMLIDAVNGKQTATKNFIEIMKHITGMPVL